MSFEDLVKSFGPAKRSIKTGRTTATISQGKILVISDLSFLVERDEEGNMPEDLSTWTIQEDYRDMLLEMYETIIMLWNPASETFLSTGGMGKADSHTGIEHLEVLDTSYSVTTEKLIEALKKRNVRLSLPRNRRTVSWLNLGKFVNDKRVDFVGVNDHSALGLSVPKKKSFTDSSQERSRSSNW